MSQLVKTNADNLKFLAQAHPQYRRALLKAADKNLVHCLCECVHNTLQGRVTLTAPQKSKLSKHKNLLRKIARKGDSFKTKKRLVQQGGAFLPLLLAPIISGIFSRIFDKK